MITNLQRPIKFGILFIAFLLTYFSANSTTFTAQASGNWSSTTTWGGAAPSFNPTVDIITIPATIAVTLDNNLTVDGATALLTVIGTLNSGANYGLTINSGTLAGTGTVNVSSLVLGTFALVTFTGNVTATNLSSSATSLQAAANLMVNQNLTISGGIFTIKNGGTLGTAANANIILAGGQLALSGGTLALTSNYNVSYTNVGVMTGIELNGSGLKNITVNVPSGNAVTLSNNLTLNGTLTLTSGTLDLGGKNLTISGTGDIAVGGSGIILSSSASNIVINSSTGISGTINFGSTTNTVNNLTVNVGNGNMVKTTGNLTVNGTLYLSSGTLSLNSLNLQITGNVSTGTGDIVSTSSDLMINTSASISGALNFSGASNGLNNVTINVGPGNTVQVSGSITVSGTLTFSSGNLVLNNTNLTITGDVTSAGSGGITSTSGSNLYFNSTASMTGSLNFTGTGSSLNNLTVNVGSGNNAKIMGTLNVTGTLALTGGALSLNNTNLTLSGNLTSSANGGIISNSNSNITINGSASLTGAINFTGNSVINNFVLNIGTGNNAQITGSLTVAGNLNLASGTLAMNSMNLTINGNILANANGMISSNGASNLIIIASNSMTGSLNFTNAANALNNFSLTIGSGNTAQLSGKLSVNGNLTLTSGTLVLSNADLTIAGDVAAGLGGIISSTSTSNLTISSSNSITGSLKFDNGNNTLHNFTVNIGGNGSVKLSSDLNIQGTLNFMGGKLDLSNNKLIFLASATVTGAGSSSYIITGSTGAVLMSMTAGSAATTFHVGTSTQYLPATITLNSGSSSGKVDVGVSENVFVSGTSGADLSLTQKLVDATWMVHSDITTNLNLNLQLGWAASAEVNGFNRNTCYISHYINSKWDASAVAAASVNGSMYSMTRTNITSLSPFAVFEQGAISNGINAENVNSTFSLYPNPASEQITVITNGSDENPVHLRIINMKGQVVKDVSVTNREENISVSTLEPGCYYIKMDNENTYVTKEFIKVQ